jgi:tRNA pseudouridine38-40 synthase
LRLALLIEYDGTDFSGWQFQPGLRTVQGELESAFRKISSSEVSVISAGRTDAGVHAEGMIAHVDLDHDLPPLARLIEGLNATSGYDVVVKDIREVPQEFHARFSALARRYRFDIVRNRSALHRRYALEVRLALDTIAMQQAAALLLGDHDFTSFSKRSEDVEHYRCNVIRSEWVQKDDFLHYHLVANRFVRGMVRATVGLLLEVGKGNMTVGRFEELLYHPEELDRARHLVAAQGLYLEKIDYAEEFGLW